MINDPVHQQPEEIGIIEKLYRLRNEHKADSAELLFADTVSVYMKYLRNVPRKKITEADKAFWKSHPKNRFEITAPIQVKTVAGITTGIVYGNEYLDGRSPRKERIEIKFDSRKKIKSLRGFSL